MANKMKLRVPHDKFQWQRDLFTETCNVHKSDSEDNHIVAQTRLQSWTQAERLQKWSERHQRCFLLDSTTWTTRMCKMIPENGCYLLMSVVISTSCAMHVELHQKLRHNFKCICSPFDWTETVWTEWIRIRLRQRQLSLIALTQRRNILTQSSPNKSENTRSESPFGYEMVELAAKQDNKKTKYHRHRNLSVTTRNESCVSSQEIRKLSNKQTMIGDFAEQSIHSNHQHLINFEHNHVVENVKARLTCQWRYCHIRRQT